MRQYNKCGSVRNDDDGDSIKLTISKEEVKNFVKNNFGVIMWFLQSEECKCLKRETGFSKSSVSSFLIETSISDELNKAIKQTMEKMHKVKKCFNLILNNAHAVYVYTVLKILKELEIPKGNQMKNKD